MKLTRLSETRLSGLVRTLVRPLFSETDAFRSRRWLRFGFLAPVAAFAGGLWGSLLGTPEGIFAGAGIFVAAAYLHSRLHPALVQWAETRLRVSGKLASLAVDLVVVVGGGLVLTRGLGMPWSSSVSSALAVGGGAALGFAWVLGDGGANALHSVLSPGIGTGRRAPGHSRVDSLLALGDVQAAESALEEMVHAYPADADAWVSLSRLQAGPLGDPDRGALTLSDGLRAMRRNRPGQARLIKQLLLIREAQGEPLQILPILSRYMDRWPPGPEREWAAGVRTRLKAEILSSSAQSEEDR